MISYNDFQLTSAQIEHIKRDNANRAISKYIKENGAEPSSTEEYFTVTDEYLERYRRIYYSRYLCGGYTPPQSGSTTDPGDTSGGGGGGTIIGVKTYTVSYNLTKCSKESYSKSYTAGSTVESVTFYPKGGFKIASVTCTCNGKRNYLLVGEGNSYSTPSIKSISADYTYDIVCEKSISRIEPFISGTEDISTQ